jgi:enterochelin esterase-like enzyme
LIITSTIIGLTYAQEVAVSSGNLRRLQSFKSQYVDARNVDIWLPDGYSTKEKYAVIYMHDGQMLYDAKSTWNKQSWEIDETASRLIAEGKTQQFIVVGIWNNGLKRHSEYFPNKPYQTIDTDQQKIISDILIKRGKTNSKFNPISDNYLKFIVTELKPFIDNNFYTYSDSSHTFIAGSSMGGLISLYAICEFPKVFGGAACLSTHWTGIYQNNDNPIPDAFFSYLKKNLPNPKNHKIYFDYGDKTLDSLYKPTQTKVDKVLMIKGYTSLNAKTNYFPGDDHSEKSWKKRINIPLEFFLKQ